MFYQFPDENQQNGESPEVSQTTGSSTDSSAAGSTGGSTPSVEPVQPIEIPEVDGERKYLLTNWTYEEMKKLIPKKTRQKISKFYLITRKPSLHKPEHLLEAEEFFETEFPQRSPYAVYQKAMKFNRKKITRIILM